MSFMLNLCEGFSCGMAQEVLHSLRSILHSILCHLRSPTLLHHGVPVGLGQPSLNDIRAVVDPNISGHEAIRVAARVPKIITVHVTHRALFAFLRKSILQLFQRALTIRRLFTRRAGPHIGHLAERHHGCVREESLPRRALDQRFHELACIQASGDKWVLLVRVGEPIDCESPVGFLCNWRSAFISISNPTERQNESMTHLLWPHGSESVHIAGIE